MAQSKTTENPRDKRTEFESSDADDNDRPRKATADFGAGQVMLSERFDIEIVANERETVTGGVN